VLNHYEIFEIAGILFIRNIVYNAYKEYMKELKYLYLGDEEEIILTFGEEPSYLIAKLLAEKFNWIIYILEILNNSISDYDF